MDITQKHPGPMKDTIFLPCSVQKRGLEIVIEDRDTAHLGSMQEPYASAFVHAVNCHDDLLTALKAVDALWTENAHSFAEEMNFQSPVGIAWKSVKDAIAKASGQ